MSEYKEFQGKSLDAAIAEACAHYDAPREKLEIEIVQDAKSGIFGLVGARKALVRARLTQLPGVAKNKPQRSGRQTKKAINPEEKLQDGLIQGNLDSGDSEDPHGESAGAETHRAQPRKKSVAVPKDSSSMPDMSEEQKQEEPRDKPQDSSRDGYRKVRGQAAPHERASRSVASSGQHVPHGQGDNGDNADEDTQDFVLPHTPLAELDQEKLKRTSHDVINTLISSVVDEASVEVSVSNDRVIVSINGEDTGLLIGREGQNLAAVQYLAARIISRLMDAQVRVQVDAGDYHSRQDSRLQDLARNLAEKVRLTGKSMSTKPLSAYQRRVIHLCLQEDTEVYTRSSGEGALKRVVIIRRKDGNVAGQE